MDDLNRLYKGSFFKNRRSLNWRVPIVCGAIQSVLNPKSLIDLGCGNGDLVKGFLDLGVDAYGVEGTTNCLASTVIPEGRLSIKDLRIPIVFNDSVRFDLCICFEVAEHLEPFAADILVSTICKASDHVLFTAAGPGQGGVHHVNCQPKSYWVEKFTNMGYWRAPSIEYSICLKLEESGKHMKKGIKAYYQNLMYFEKKRLS